MATTLVIFASSTTLESWLTAGSIVLVWQFSHFFLTIAWYDVTTLSSFCFSLTVLFWHILVFILQHYYKIRESIGEGGSLVERDLCGLCTLSVTDSAGQPWTRVTNWRYGCCILNAVCFHVSVSLLLYSINLTGCSIDVCTLSRNLGRESQFLHTSRSS